MLAVEQKHGKVCLIGEAELRHVAPVDLVDGEQAVR